MATLTPVCVWRISDRLVVALDTAFSDPLDAYVNGSQTWLRDDGPGGVVLEWRLHPVPRFRRPDGFGTYDLFPRVAAALVDGGPAPVPVESLWDGLECFPAYDDEVPVDALRVACVGALGLEPDASGLVDHRSIGDAWERSRGALSIIDELLAQLARDAAQ